MKIPPKNLTVVEPLYLARIPFEIFFKHKWYQLYFLIRFYVQRRMTFAQMAGKIDLFIIFCKNNHILSIKGLCSIHPLLFQTQRVVEFNNAIQWSNMTLPVSAVMKSWIICLYPKQFCWQIRNEGHALLKVLTWRLFLSYSRSLLEKLPRGIQISGTFSWQS